MEKLNNEVSSIRVQPFAGFHSNAHQQSGPGILSPLIPLSYVALKHNWSAECCSTKTHYEFRGRNKELVLTAYAETCNKCCECGRPPIYVQGLDETTMIQVQIGIPDCCSTRNEVEIHAPPGIQIGCITIKANFCSETNYTVSSMSNSQTMSVKRKTHFFTEEYLFKNENGESVACITCESVKFRLEIQDETVDPTMKANLIGFMLMLDVYRRARQAAASSS